MTHNLHILIKSTEGFREQSIESPDVNQYNNFILDMVYDHIANVQICRNFMWRGQEVDTLIYWKKEQINDIERNFMGDLFTTSIHSDALQYELTKIALNEIENNIKKDINNTKWKIIFHISKLLDI